jgi:hypothetical protein
METLDPFYENLIKLYNVDKKMCPDKNETGWASLYYGIFSRIIKENNFKKCAEIGIGYGFHAKEILDNTNVEKLYLVDPMQHYENDGFPTDVLSYGGFEVLVKNIKCHLSVHKDRYEWFRQPSITVTNDQIPDGSLDAIFIDGDHSYEAVTQDLKFWWKKLRVGGWLLGDDYGGSFIGTTAAVDEFANNNQFNMEILHKNNSSSYPIYKFIKYH